MKTNSTTIKASTQKYLPVYQEFTSEDESNMRSFVGTNEYKSLIKILDNRRADENVAVLNLVTDPPAALAHALMISMIDDLKLQLSNYSLPAEEPNKEERETRLADYQP